MLTVLFIKKPDAKRVAFTGILVSIGLILHYAESLLPVFQIIPGGKLGIANVVTLLAFSWFGPGFALLVGLLRCILSSLFAGAVTMIAYSGVGTLASVVTMWTAQQCFSKAVSTVGRSMLGAFAFNVGQVAVCALVLKNVYVFSYLPPLTVLAAVCGLFTGMLAKRTEKILH